MSPEQVECHSGTTYGERPIAFYWEGERLLIVDIEARWRLPDGRKFRVRVENDRTFELYYVEQVDEWRISVA